MKLGKWKVLGLAGVLALGYVSQAKAFHVKVDENTFADIYLNMKVWYKNYDKKAKDYVNSTTGDWRRNVFEVEEAQINFMGQVNKLVQFYGEYDQDQQGPQLNELGVNFAFAKEFQFLAGLIRNCFTRADISSSYNRIVPTKPFLDPQKAMLFNIFEHDGNTHYGAMVHGDLFGGMFTYRVGIYNNDFRVKQDKDFVWNARVEFQPLMLGFKPESAATPYAKVKDTYLGKKDVLTIGLGYFSAKEKKSYWNEKWNENWKKLEDWIKKWNITIPSYPNDLKLKDRDVDGWTVDFLFEKKFGDFVPNLQAGYVSLSDTHLNPITNKSEDSDGWYVQGQLLYDQVVGCGKPAIAVRFNTSTHDKAYNINNRAKDAKLDRWGVALNYYIKEQDAKVVLGFDYLKYRDGAKDFLKDERFEDSLTDWYLLMQVKF
jgi:hypothetical protein